MLVLLDDMFCCKELSFVPDTLVTEITLANNDVFENENRFCMKLNSPVYEDVCDDEEASSILYAKTKEVFRLNRKAQMERVTMYLFFIF